jgi:hypothetical protein
MMEQLYMPFHNAGKYVITYLDLIRNVPLEPKKYSTLANKIMSSILQFCDRLF